MMKLAKPFGNWRKKTSSLFLRWVVNSGHENSTQLFAVDKTGAHMQPGKDNRVFSVFFGGYK
ncbi:MAG: hypothetical protein ACYC2W_03610, partial [Desulfurivibrionaceae bacterium]